MTSRGRRRQPSSRAQRTTARRPRGHRAAAIVASEPGGQPVAPVTLQPFAPVAPQPVTPAVPTADAGQPASGTFVTSEVLPVYDAPSTRAVLQGRVMSGKVLTVSRQYSPSPTEEWLFTDAGWVARRLEGIPGAIFGTLTP